MPRSLNSPSNSPILTYEDVREEVRGRHSSILLGNGFSIACDPIFTYGSLYQAAVEAGLSERAKKVFQRLGSNNFEGVMRLLTMSHWVATIYGLVRPSEQSGMLEDLDVIKDALIQAIGSSHLSRPGEIQEHRRERAVEWLGQYSMVFTTNYDLLLYWITMNGNPPLFDDGFRNNPDDPSSLVYSFYSRDRRMYYLHGALHLFLKEGQLCKHRSGTDGLCLTDLIRESLSHGHYPLFVAESSAEDKLSQIHESPYLSNCLDKFSGVTDKLVILGHSLGETDRHILDSIVRNRRLSVLYVGLHGDPENAHNQATQAAARRLKDQRAQRSDWPPLEINFFSSESAGVWDESV